MEYAVYYLGPVFQTYLVFQLPFFNFLSYEEECSFLQLGHCAVCILCIKRFGE